LKLKTKIMLLRIKWKIRRLWDKFTDALPFVGKGIAERRAKRLEAEYWAYMRSLPLNECFYESVRMEGIRRKVMAPDPLPGGEENGR
jgi:hypothetical protein